MTSTTMKSRDHTLAMLAAIDAVIAVMGELEFGERERVRMALAAWDALDGQMVYLKHWEEAP